MWNRKWQFKPAEIIGLLALVERDTAEALDFGRPMIWVAAPYDLIPYEILVYESYRLMHTLVTDTASETGHNAVEEALLYGLCHAVLEPGSEEEFTAEALQTVNALRRRARQRPLRELRRLEASVCAGSGVVLGSGLATGERGDGSGGVAAADGSARAFAHRGRLFRCDVPPAQRLGTPSGAGNF